MEHIPGTPESSKRPLMTVNNPKCKCIGETEPHSIRYENVREGAVDAGSQTHSRCHRAHALSEG